jgi:predicted nucleic acid-binding protein
MNGLDQPQVPLYLDTTVLWRERLIAGLRATFPGRALCVPAVAHFERVRQLRLKLRDSFDPAEIRTFIETHDLTLVALDQQVADQIAKMAEWVDQHGQRWIPEWPEQRTDVAKTPCGQRCRLGDYAIAATAKVHGGILLSDDETLRTASNEYPNLFPQTVSSVQVGEVLHSCR